MYAVIRYFNYRKDISFKILKTFNSLDQADNYALKCAEDDFGEGDVVQGVAERRVYVDEVYDGYTKGDGYDYYVYSVIEIPEAEDDESDSASGTSSEHEDTN